MIKRFSEELKEARLKKDITLQQLFTKTRIDIKFLEAIENGNFDVLPDVYLRAFIKSYASAVGLEENVTLKKYDAAKAGRDFDEKPGSAEIHAPAKEERRPEPRAERRPEKNKEYISIDTGTSSYQQDDSPRSGKGLNANMAWLVLSGVSLAVILVVYFVFFRTSSNQIISEKPYDEYINQNKERFEDTAKNSVIPPATSAGTSDSLQKLQQNASQPNQAAPLKPDSLTLSIKSSADAWIKVTADDNSKTYEFTLPANFQKAVRAKRNFHMIVGNAAVVELQLNNSRLNFSGKPGEVKVAKIDWTGLVYSRPYVKSTTPTTPKVQ